MNDPLPRPFLITMYVAQAIFSPPRSPRIRDGIPNSSIASRKTSSTVVAWLFELARNATICRHDAYEFTSILEKQNDDLPFDSIRPQSHEKRYPNGSSYGVHQCARQNWGAVRGIFDAV